MICNSKIVNVIGSPKNKKKNGLISIIFFKPIKIYTQNELNIGLHFVKLAYDLAFKIKVLLSLNQFYLAFFGVNKKLTMDNEVIEWIIRGQLNM